MSAPWVALIASTPARKPSTWLPLSPMKTRAGCVLKRRKPSKAPASAAVVEATGPLPVEMPIQPMASTDNSVVPPARPSSPSERLMALVTPTRNTKLNASDSAAGRSMRSVSVVDSIDTPPTVTASAHASICAPSFQCHASSCRSSSRPMTSSTPAAQWIAIHSPGCGAMNHSGNNVPATIASPPMRGIGAA